MSGVLVNLFIAAYGMFFAFVNSMSKSKNEDKIKEINKASLELIGVYTAVIAIISGFGAAIGNDVFFRVVKNMIAEHKTLSTISLCLLLFAFILPVSAYLLDKFDVKISNTENAKEHLTLKKKRRLNRISWILFSVAMTMLFLLVLNLWTKTF